MTLEEMLGWSVLLSLLLTASAALMMPLLLLLERAVSFGRARWFLRSLAVAAGAVVLWHAIPLVVNALYHTDRGVSGHLHP
jgi:hypothetical protein